MKLLLPHAAPAPPASRPAASAAPVPVPVPTPGSGGRQRGGCTHLASSSSGVSGHFAASRAVTAGGEAGAPRQGQGQSSARSRASSASGASSAAAAIRGRAGRAPRPPPPPHRDISGPAHAPLSSYYWLRRAVAVVLLVSPEVNQRLAAYKQREWRGSFLTRGGGGGAHARAVSCGGDR